MIDRVDNDSLIENGDPIIEEFRKKIGIDVTENGNKNFWAASPSRENGLVCELP